MAIVHRVAHLSKLAFFLSLGVAAAIVHACSNESEDEDKGPDASTGGTTPADSSGVGGTRATAGGAGTQVTAGGAGSNTSAETTAGTAIALGGRSGIKVDPSTSRSGNGGLWDVICE